jgi:hypothetical protein
MKKHARASAYRTVASIALCMSFYNSLRGYSSLVQHFAYGSATVQDLSSLNRVNHCDSVNFVMPLFFH